jgi:hypothetical protein
LAISRPDIADTAVTEQRAVQQRRWPGRGGRPADEDQDARHVKQVKQDGGRGSDLAQHVADLHSEKALATSPKNRKSIGTMPISVARWRSPDRERHIGSRRPPAFCRTNLIRMGRRPVSMLGWLATGGPGGVPAAYAKVRAR